MDLWPLPGTRYAYRTGSSMNEQSDMPNGHSRPAPQPAPAPSPAARLRLPGRVCGLTSAEYLSGPLTNIRASYEIFPQAVHIVLHMGGDNEALLCASYVHTRAAIATLRGSLDTFARFRVGSNGLVADFPPLGQVNCRRYSCSSVQGPDEELRFQFLLRHGAVQLAAEFSDLGGGSVRYSVLAYLRRTEAEALLYDLERGLADGEHYGRFGS